MEYNVEVPESLKREKPKGPRRPRKEPVEATVEVKEEPKKVALDTKKRRVRLRGADYALPCTVMTEDREIRVTLQPNRWTDVPEEIYQMLKRKFGQTVEREVPDWDVSRNERTPRMESPNAPIIEGL